MNSRDAAYEAVFQRVLEESKSDVKVTGSRTGTRGRKRGSSEGSDEYVITFTALKESSADSQCRPKEYKRARTSDSDTPTSATVESGDEKSEKVAISKSANKKGRNGNTREITATSFKRTSTRSKAVDKTKDSKKDGK